MNNSSGVIIEKVSGEKYAEYPKKHIFGPLDMQDTGYDDTKSILKNRASGYQPGPDGLVNKYGYGWQLGPMANHKQIGHGGGIFGFSTYIARFPEDNACVVVLSNSVAGNPGSVAAALAGTLFGEKVDLPGEKKEISLDSKILDRYVGVYQVGEMTMTVTNEAGHLMIQPKGQAKLEAFASSEIEFFLKPVDAAFVFLPGENGKAKEIQLKQGGGAMAGKRVN